MLIWSKASCLVSLLALSGVPATQPPSFRAQIQLVALNVTVIDDRGAVVRGLSQQAFGVTEDGRTQPIVQFASDPVSLSLAIALDASGSMAGRRFNFASEAVTRFLDRLGPDDEVIAQMRRSSARRNGSATNCGSST